MDPPIHPDSYTEEPSSWPFIFAYPMIVGFLVTIFIPLFIAPWVGNTFLPTKYPKLEKKQSLFRSLFASTLHAIVITSIIIYLLWTEALGPTLIFSKSPYGLAVMQFSLGYFIGDTTICLLDKHLRKDKSMLTHHVVGMIGISLSLYCQGRFMFFVLVRELSEFSTPNVNLFCVLMMLDKRESKLFLVNSLLMVATFFLCRIAPFLWVWRDLITALLDPLSVIVPIHLRVWTVMNSIALDALNILWFWKMLRGTIKYFRNSKNLKDVL